MLPKKKKKKKKKKEKKGGAVEEKIDSTLPGAHLGEGPAWWWWFWDEGRSYLQGGLEGDFQTRTGRLGEGRLCGKPCADHVAGQPVWRPDVRSGALRSWNQRMGLGPRIRATGPQAVF